MAPSQEKAASTNTGFHHKPAKELTAPQPVVNVPGRGHELRHQERKAVPTQADSVVRDASAGHEVRKPCGYPPGTPSQVVRLSAARSS